MPSEVTAYIQTQAQTQTLQISNVSSESEAIPGVFDALMNEYALTEQDMPAIAETEDTTQLITFTSNHSFTQSVIDILAGRSENVNLPPEMPDTIGDITGKQKDSKSEIIDEVQSIISKVKAVISEKIGELKSENPEDINEIVSQILKDKTIPEETKNEIVKAVENFVRDFKDTEFNTVDVIRRLPKEHKVSASVDEPEPEIPREENEDEDENIAQDDTVEDVSVNIAGLAVIPNAETEHADTITKNESQTESQDTNHSVQIQSRNVSHEPKNVSQKAEAKPETESVNTESKFDEHIERPDSENRTSNQNGNTSGQEENSSEHEQTQDNNSGTQTVSRLRNDTRRTSAATSRTQNDRTDTNSNRTESHNTFQSFFEGVLTNRRNASRTSPLPLNLSQNQRESSYTLNSSQTLRDGMINVVRFIRADGMHKANVIVDPPALGRISVELTSSSSGVEASIKVASEQIRQLVQNQISELRMNLSQQGVQVAEFTVDVQQDNSNGNHQSNNEEGNRYRTFAFQEAEDDTEEFRIDLEEGLLYWVA